MLTTLLIAFLLGALAGMRSMTPPAGIAWAAHLGRVPLAGSALAFIDNATATYVLTAFALAELVADKLPKTPSRKTPAPFVGRIVVGAFAGATFGRFGGSAVAGGVVGALGAVVGTLGGAAFRSRLAAGFGRDLPAAVIEDVMAVGGTIVICFVVA